MKYKHLIILLITPMFFSCSKKGVEYLSVEESNVIPIRESLAYLDDFLAGTKSEGSSYDLNDIFIIGRSSIGLCTKSNEIEIPDTLLYAVNFSEGGFALLAADKNLNNHIICVTDMGRISNNDFEAGYTILSNTIFPTTTEETGFDEEDFIDVGKDYLYSLLLSSAMIDYSDNTTITAEQEATKDYSPGQIGPFLMTKWFQDPLLRINSSREIGCVVVAIAQIMAYNNKPYTSSFASVHEPWYVIRTVNPYYNYLYEGEDDARQALTNLFAELGNSSNCDVSADGGSNADKAKRTLENYGYRNVSKRLGCEPGDINKINQWLEDRLPVFMTGMRDVNGRNVGHAWVIDGMKDSCFHINWGWHGDCDGYYTKGIFNTSQTVSYDDAYDPGYSSVSIDYYHIFRSLYYQL